MEYRDIWDRRATIRSRPRRWPVGTADAGDFYPPMRQPLVIHPDVAALGAEATSFVLIQSSYKYMNDIAVTETEIINRTALAIANDRYPGRFSKTVRQGALTVVIDEAYHALVARDYIDAVQRNTGVPPLALPTETELSRAIAATKAELPTAWHDDFDVVAVCIAENTLTHEIVDLSRQAGLASAFTDALSDHLADEARHATFFRKVLDLQWRSIDEDRRTNLGGALPAFLAAYLNVNVQRSFDATVLRALSVPEGRAASILAEIHDCFTLGPHHPMLANILALLRKVGVLDHAPTRTAFASRSLIAL